jgi:hypothetical protein
MSQTVDEYEYRVLLKQTLRRSKAQGEYAVGDTIQFPTGFYWSVVEVLPGSGTRTAR